MWDDTTREVFQSFPHVLSSFGADASFRNTRLFHNGLKVHEYVCDHMGLKCYFRARVYYPLPVDGPVEAIPQVKNNHSTIVYKLIDCQAGPVVLQIANQHTCRLCGGWRSAIINPQKRVLHPILAQAVRCEAEKDPLILLPQMRCTGECWNSSFIMLIPSFHMVAWVLSGTR